VFLLPFHVVSCSHERNTPDTVGQLRVGPERLTALLGTLRAHGQQAVIVSTCHRTELYWWGDDDLEPWFAQAILGGAAESVQVERADADLAVRHLFAVAAGMRSVRYGEGEILGQVRRAWMGARAAGTARHAIDGTFRQAIDAARHIRHAMGSEADPSLGQQVRARVAAAVARASADRVPVLLVGSGDAARSVLDAWQAAPVAGASLRIMSRTAFRAEALARRGHLPVVPWEERVRAIAESPVVVFAVHVTTPLVDGAFVRTHLLADRAPPRTWIDLGVPGAVAPEVVVADAIVVDGSATAVAPVDLVTLRDLEGHPSAAMREERARRAGLALQRELARYAQTTRRLQLGERLGSLEARAIAVAAEHERAPVDEVARRVTRLVLRELSRV
jgi:glutamyl-tRNA reductase